MSIALTIDADFSGAESLLDQVIDQLDGPSQAGLQRIGATAARTALQHYHTEFETARRWTNPSLSTHGAGRLKSQFGEEIASAWTLGHIGQKSAELVNAAPFFAQKVYGGIITPKRVSSLTIPLIPEAHGRTVATYQRVFGVRLFRPRGKRVLMENRNGRVRGVYALVKSVKQKPWPGALPEEAVIAEPFVEAVERELFRLL